MISIRRISLGGGWRYLIESVAAGDGAAGHASDLARYYTESGTPPGRFLGKGLADLADGQGIRAGSQVREQHLERMLAGMTDPVTGAPVGKPARAGGGRAPVAGFDLTFSPPKSVSVAWALADQGTKAIIYACHRQAIEVVFGWAEASVLKSRSGTNGIAEEDITGAVATAFTHWASRTDDPQLHDHVVVWNRAKSASDGQWRTLDSRALFKAAVTVSEMHQGVLEDLLTGALGVGWDGRTRRHSDRPRYEITGVPEQLMREFSTRAEKIAERKERLEARFTATHGRAPTSVEALRLRQQATLETRPAKTHRSLDELTAAWRARAHRHVPRPRQVAWVASLAGRGDLPPLRASDIGEQIIDDAAAAVLAWVAERRATYSQMNLAAEAHRLLHGVIFASPADRVATAERITDAAARQSIALTSPGLARTPAIYRRGDGSNRLHPASRIAYTSRQVLEAEARLLAAGRVTTGPAVDAGTVARVLAGPLPGRGHRLSPDQAAAVTKVAVSGRVLDVLIGPAGAGKTAALAGLRALWEAAHGPGSVTGLAPSANAAEVLAAELGIATENTAKWLTEWRRVPGLAARRDQLAAQLARHPGPSAAAGLRAALAQAEQAIAERSPRPGQLIIVDEASLAGTFALDELVAAATAAGAKVLLAGDPAQIQAVDAGGALAMLAADRDASGGAPRLGEIRRFTNRWERRASLQLRAGQPDALAAYAAHGRITGGDRDQMLEAIYQGWQADVAAGKTSLMIATSDAAVAELSARARTDRIAAGQVAPEGLTIGGGNTAGAGDLVVTRKNNRLLAAGRGWVKNGHTWTVVATHDDGSMTVRRTKGHGQVVLPASYVREHVELGYAVTAHRAEGITVDTAHGYITPAASRELLYVTATRGRESNRLYVDTRYDPDPVTGHDKVIQAQNPMEVLTGVLAREPAEMAAHEAIRRSREHAASLPALAAEYATIAATAQAARWEALLDRCPLTSQQRQAVRSSPAYGALLAAWRAADAAGLDVEAAIPRLVAARDLDGAADPAAVLHQRTDDWAATARPRPRPDGGLIAGLIPRATGITDPDLAEALADRDHAMTARATALAETALARGEMWITRLGAPPADPGTRSRWLAAAATVAAYRDLHGITNDPRPLGDPAAARSSEQATHQARAAQAARHAIDLADGHANRPGHEHDHPARPAPGAGRDETAAL